MTVRRILVTGASSGIGEQIVEQALEAGCEVWGLSRRVPTRFARHQHWHFASIDLAKPAAIAGGLLGLIGDAHPGFDEVFLNAGSFGPRPRKAHHVPLADFEALLALNLVANKEILDVLLHRAIPVATIVVSSSIAAIRQREGMLAYSASKAALNAIIAVYAKENPGIFFALLGLCNVDTLVGATITDVDEEFPELLGLRARATSDGYVVSPSTRAADIARVLANREKLGLRSGEFAEIRTLLKAMPDRAVPADAERTLLPQ